MWPVKRALLLLLLAASTARAECPPSQAACLLHEEGTTLLAAGRYADAATKFKASLAASPSARTYLGYALALEGSGRFPLAYEAISEAQRLSAQELAQNPGDVEATSRSERIKYKLGELRMRVGMLRLELPPTVSPDAIVAIQRGDEGDLRAPLVAAFAVMPNHQPLTVRLRDGRSFELIATVAAGAESSMVIPIPGASSPVTARPSRFAAVIDVAVMPADDVDGGNAFGGLVRAEVHAGRRVSLSARVGYLLHADFAQDYVTSTGTLRQVAESGELALLGGVRAAVHGPLYAAAEAGLLRYAYSTEVRDPLGMVVASDAKALWYAGLAVATGVRWNRLDGRLGVMVPVELDDVPSNERAFELPVRVMVSIGLEVFPF